MQISETTFTINSSGSLIIPETVLREMKLAPGNTVRVAYLTQDGYQNTFQEFFLSSDPFDELSDDYQLRIPNHLLEQSNIPADADLQIICIGGCIIICQDSALSSDELASVLESLHAAGELTAVLTGEPEQMQEKLTELIKHFQEGANTGEV